MGPLLTGHLNLKMRSHFRSQGFGFFKINRLMEGFNPDTIQAAAAEAELSTPGTQAKFEELTSMEAPLLKAGMVGAIGDGTILQNLIAAIKEFAASDFGKALIAALEKLLLSFLI